MKTKYICEGCNAEVDSYRLPSAWIRVTCYGPDHAFVHRHYCSDTCLMDWMHVRAFVGG